MVQYVDFRFIERNVIAYEGEYEFMKKDITPIVSVAYPVIFVWEKCPSINYGTHVS